MNYGQRFMTLYRRQGSRPSPWKRNANKQNFVSTKIQRSGLGLNKTTYNQNYLLVLDGLLWKRGLAGAYKREGGTGRSPISPDGQHQNQIDSILCSQRWRRSIQSAKTRPGADCGSDHELLIAKFRLKLKKVVNTTRPNRYKLNQILMINSGSEK